MHHTPRHAKDPSQLDAHPAVTVIVPLYNVERYVAECLQSVQSQDFTDYEVLCIDDGSTDATLAVAKAAVAGDDRFSFFSSPHGGQSAARNIGLDYAMGDFVIFLDSDDYWLSGCLSTLMAEMRHRNLDLLYFTADTRYEDAESAAALQEDMLHRDSCHDVMSGPELFIWFEERRQFWVSGPLQIVKRSLIEDHDIRLLEGCIHEDELYTVQLLTYAERATFLNAPLYMRRVRTGSTMTQKRGMRNIKAFWRITRIMDEWIREHGAEYPPKFVDMYARRIFESRDTMARDSIFVDEAELDAFAQTLSPSERAEFNIYVRDNGRNIDRLYKEMTDTTSFKVGNAIASVLRR
jgi:glycosyltransferase involved in cell wall biosynthesis